MKNQRGRKRRGRAFFPKGERLLFFSFSQWIDGLLRFWSKNRPGFRNSLPSSFCQKEQEVSS